MSGPVNIEKCFGQFEDLFLPKIVGELNGQHVKLLLFEPAGIEHAGKVKSEITKEEFDRLDM